MGKYWWQNDGQQSSGQQTAAQQTNNQQSGYWWQEGNLSATVGNNITNRVNTWLKNHDNYVKNYQTRYGSRKFNYEDDYVKDSGSWLDTVSKQKSNFDAEADSILEYMDKNQRYLDKGWMKSVKDTLTSARGAQQSILDNTAADYEWWNGFGSEELVKAYGSAEEAYKYYQRDDGYRKKYSGMNSSDLSQVMARMDEGEERTWLESYTADVDNEEKLRYDLAAGQQEIDALTARLQKLKLSRTVPSSHFAPQIGYPANYAYAAAQQGIDTDSIDKEIDALTRDISKKQRYLDQAKFVQELAVWNSVADKADFDAKSKYVENFEYGLFGKPEFTDDTYAYVNNPMVEDKRPLGAGEVSARSLINTEDFAYRADSPLRNRDSSYERDALDQMTEEEVKIYNYYYATEGKEKAREYLDFLVGTFNERKDQQTVQNVSEFANEHPWIASAMSVGTSLGSGFEYIGDVLEYAGDKITGKNASLGTNENTLVTNAVRQTVSDKVDWEIGNWDAFDFVYNTTMSGLDSAASMAFGGMGSTVLGLSAAAQGTNDALSRGMSDGQAFWNGLFSGVFEGLFESVSIGNFKHLQELTPKSVKDIVKNLGKSMLVNASEETLTEIANIAYDTLVNGEFANYTMEELENGAWKEALAQIIEAGASGALMGFGMGAVGNTMGYYNGYSQRYGEVTTDLINEGLESSPDSRSYKLAQKYQKQVQGKNGKDGKALSGVQIQKLVKANEAQFKVENFNEVLPKAKGRLETLGETENVEGIANLVAKRVSGQKLTRTEKSTLVRSQFGAQVAKELSTPTVETQNGTKIYNATYKSLEERVGTEGRFNVSESGQSAIRDGNEAIALDKSEVVTVGDGQVTVKLEDGREVYAGDIDFADESESLLYSGVSDIENITPAAANAIIHDIVDTAKPIGEQLNGIDEAYTYGYNGYSVEDMKTGNFTANLSEQQMMSAYRLGESARKISDVDADAPVIKMRTAAEAKLTAKQKLANQKAMIKSNDVEVYFEDGGKVVKFKDSGKYDAKRMAAVNTARFLSKLGIGGKYYFYESYKNADGVLVYKDADGNEVEAPNGMYKDADGSIHIDLNAGDEGQGTALFTMGHELTHFIKAQSRKQFKVLGDLVTEAFAKTDRSMHERVVAKQDFLSDKRGHHVSYTEAYEEVVADAMSTMLSDGSFYEKIMEIKVKDRGLFNTIKRFFDKMIAKFKQVYAELDPDQQDARDIREMKDMFDRIQTAFAEALVEASDNFHAAMESVVDTKAEPVGDDEIITEGAVVTDGEGVRHSIRSMKHDIAEGKMFEDLKNICGWTDAQVATLRNQLKDLVEYMIPYRNILDMNETYGMEGRRFSPYKPNSDPLYKISMDFSTLCSKRLLTQYVIENLQLRENRPMSAEEQMAIRAMLNEYRKVEKGLQVACAMCYVEAARLKSPKQMQRWLDNPAPLLKDYFAKKNKAFNDSVKKAQADFKESKGYDREAPKKDMKPADVKVLNQIGPKMRTQYQLSAEEQAIVEKAMSLPNSTYLTAGNLANLSETDPVIYDAYTAFVRTATRSKSLETDEPYYYGDSTRDNGNGIVVTDSFIEAVNRENGMRFSSWSDWRIQHLLDYITAVIDNSVRGAAMHGYTKFGDEVRVLGKTGMMFNMSGVAGTQTGLNEDGSLNFSDTESIDVNEAIQLREEFPETAGLQCIGVGDDHIIALLRSDIIDYIIPYHVSGLNAALRRMADIHGWKDYTSTQHAAIDKSIKLDNAVDKEHWHEEPVYSEFFVGYDTGMTGIEAMRASAEKYKQMCKDRGLTPKFNQFANEENYWKLLIDRKMINQQTGKLIRQKAVTPTFDFDAIKGVVDKFVDNYDAGLEKRALNHIVENWDTLPQRIKDLKKQGGTKAKKTKKAAATLANQTVAAQPNDVGVKKSDRQKWKPKLDSTEWGIVNYIVDKNQGTAITSSCNMFFKKSKGRTLFGIYSTDDSTLLYVSRERAAEEEHIFVGLLREEYKNGNVTDTSAKGLRTWAKTVRMQRAANDNHGSGNVAPGRFEGNAELHGRPSGLYASAALRNVLENIFKEEAAGRTGDGMVKNSDRYSTGKQLSKEQQAYFADSVVRDADAEDIYSYAERGELENFKGEYEADFKERAFLLIKNELAKENKRKAEETAKQNERKVYDQKLKDVSYASTYSSDVMKAVSDFRDAWREFSGDDITELYSLKGALFENFDRIFMATNFQMFAYKYNRNADKKLVDGTDEYKKLAKLFDYAVHRTEAFYSGLSIKQKGDAYWHGVNGREGKDRISYSDRTRDVKVYHGSKSNFDSFDFSLLKDELGVFFSEDENGASQYGNVSAYTLSPQKTLVVHQGDEYRRIMLTGETDAEKRARFVKEGYDTIKLVYAKRGGGEIVEWVALTPDVINKTARSSERGDGTSNRHLLANAFEGITKSSVEYEKIQEYRDHIQELNQLETKLHQLNAEIRKIRFGTEGARDANRLRQLEDEAKDTAKEINRHDRKLLSLEASAPLRKVIDRERKKEAQKTMDHVKQIQESKKIRAEQAELRRKIRKAVRDLDKILTRGNKKRNVKEDVQNVVTKALQAADILFTENYGSYDMLRNGIGTDLSDAEEALVKTCTQMLKDLDKMPTDGYDNWQARQEAEKQLNTKMAKLKEVFIRERKRLNNTTVSSILGELADAYKSLENSEQSYVKDAYMEPVYSFLKNLQSEVGGAIVQDMTKDQLESVYAAYRMVLTTVGKANNLFNEEIKMSREQMGNAVIQEIMAAGGTHGLWTKGEIARSQASWNNMKPIWVANRIGSDSFGKLMQGLFDGQYNFAQDIEEARNFKQEMDKKYHPRNWDAEKQYEYESSTGREFSLNLQQIMSLYAFSKREQAYSHLLNGGFVFEGNSTVIVDKNGRKKTYIYNGATSYKLNEATLNEIINSLTAEQKAYVDEMQNYLSAVMGEKGNEVSMQLYGIKMFKEQFYFPLRSSGAYMEKAKEADLKKEQGQINLVNSGFTHSVKPQAKNPIILSGFLDVWAEHCNEMSMYHSMVLPMEDFRKVYNYSTVHDDKFDSASVYQTIQDAYGNAATSYIDQLYRELNSGATVDPRETSFKARISKFKKAAVMLSASVVVQQFSAIGRAYALIDPKFFIGTKVNSGTQMSAVDEMKKYAPVAIIKEIGGFDTGTKGSAKNYIMAEQYGKGERIKGLMKDEQYRGDIMGFLPAKADEKTWCAIWEAVKRETKAKNPNVDVKSEEFLKLAGERFSEIIEKTQVYDSVLARSANMRSKSALMSMATAFMAEPTTTVNLLEDAFRSGNKKHIARAFGAVAVSIVLNNALSSVVYAMRDDDEDETFIEKYFQSLASGMIDDINPMSYYPFLKDVHSLFQGYDVERADMSVIADLRDAMKKAVSVIGKYDPEMDDDELAAYWKDVNGVMMSLLDAGCSAFGVPLKNVRRDVSGLINAYTTVHTDLTKRDTTWMSFWDKVGAAAKDTIPIIAWTKDTPKAEILWEAIMAEDHKYVARIRSTYKTDDAYHNAVIKQLRENDPRIHEAAQARYDGDDEEYKRIFREVQDDFKKKGSIVGFNAIMSAVNNELSDIKKSESGDSASSNFSATDYVDAIIVEETAHAEAMREDIIASKVANGKTKEEAEESFTKSVVNAIRTNYESGLLDEGDVEEMLVAYAGMEAEDAGNRTSYWAFCKKYPQYKDLSEERVGKYYDNADPAGIPIDVYFQYYSCTKDMETIYNKWGREVKSRRDQILEFIDSLPLTSRQKDILYLDAGYKESTLWKAPW